MPSEMLYELLTNCEDPIIPGVRWLKHAQGTKFCAKCNTVRRDLYPEPIDVVLFSEPPHCSNTILTRVSLGIVHETLAAALSEHLGDFAIGRCYLESGEATPYRTMYSREYIVLRSDEPDKRVYCCETCGTTKLSNYHGYPYLEEEDLAPFTGRAVLETARCVQFVRAELMKKMDWSPWKDLEFLPIVVRDKNYFLRGGV